MVAEVREDVRLSGVIDEVGVEIVAHELWSDCFSGDGGGEGGGGVACDCDGA